MKYLVSRACLLGLFLSLLGACTSLQTSTEATTPPQVPEQVSNTAWAQDQARFAADDAASPPPTKPVVFVGSSSIRMWSSLASDFPGVAVLNRGFGGSEIRDSTWYAEPFILKYKPRLVVFYAGENDLASGRSPNQVREDFLAFVARLRRDQPKLRIAYISAKPSPSRVLQLGAQQQANALILTEISKLKHASYIDVASLMLDANGQPREDLFLADRLHMNAAGYAIWRQAVAPYLSLTTSP